MSMKSRLGAYMAMASMFAMTDRDTMERMSDYGRRAEEEGESKSPKIIIPPVPKGCKEYFFNNIGEFSNGTLESHKILRDECVFTCIASNDKTAKKKFDKWKNGTEV